MERKEIKKERKKERKIERKKERKREREREERKKERRITKLKFSCLFFFAFVWAIRTLGAFFTIE